MSIAIGETFGHFFNDFIANRYIRRHQGRFVPEVRLFTNIFIAPLLMIPGLVIVGQTLGNHLGYGLIVLGWGMYSVGMLTASIAITAFALDCYPSAAGEVSAYLNFARTFGGFSVGYFQQPWGLAMGYGTSFGIQAAIVAVAAGMAVCLSIWGKWLRQKGGPLEY